MKALCGGAGLGHQESKLCARLQSLLVFWRAWGGISPLEAQSVTEIPTGLCDCTVGTVAQGRNLTLRETNSSSVSDAILQRMFHG